MAESHLAAQIAPRDFLTTRLSPLGACSQKQTQGKTNFFERRVGEYQKAGVAAAASKEGGGGTARRFSLDADF